MELLSSDLHSDHLSTAQKSAILGDVRAQLAELNDLVGDLVHLSRDDTAGSFRPLDLRDAISAAVDRVRRRAGDRVLDVRLDELHLVGDPDGLERRSTNLLDNAVKWSPPGSTIRVRLEGNRLRVADSGPGIAEADAPYVFDRFFRGETARKTHGTGLGLSIVAKTVEDHGGSVSVGRSSDGGAEFTVQLPGVTHREALPSLLLAGPALKRPPPVKTWTYLWNHPLQRRVSLMTTVAVALAVVLFSLVGYVMMRTTLVQASAADRARHRERPRRARRPGHPDDRGRCRPTSARPGRGGRGRRRPGPGAPHARGADDLVVEPADLAAAGADGADRPRGRASRTDGQPYAVVVVPLPGTGHALLVGRSLGAGHGRPRRAASRPDRRSALAGVLAAGVVGRSWAVRGCGPCVSSSRRSST